MRKMNLLEMTQNILSSMSSDEVNSISDTVESMQVAEEIRNTFYELYSNRDITEFEGLIPLEASGDVDRPNTLVIPENVQNIHWLQYRNFRGNNTKFDIIDYLPPEEFVRRVIEADLSQHTTYLEVPILNTSSTTYAIPTNRTPQFYTILDGDNTLVFDSFDAEYESNLTAASSIAWGIMAKDFDLEDSFVPPIDNNLFPHLLAEAKSACFINIKEVANSKEEQRARRQLVRSQTRINKTKDQREGIFDHVDYSRGRGGTSRRTHRRRS